MFFVTLSLEETLSDCNHLTWLTIFQTICFCQMCLIIFSLLKVDNKPRALSEASLTTFISCAVFLQAMKEQFCSQRFGLFVKKLQTVSTKFSNLQESGPTRAASVVDLVTSRIACHRLWGTIRILHHCLRHWSVLCT